MLALVLGFSVKQSAGSWKDAVIVGKMLIDSFSSRYVEQTSITAAEELVRGLTFETYSEKIYCQILTKIKETDFEAVVNRISSRYQIPYEIKGTIMDGQYSGDANQAVVREFKFQKGGPGKVLYGKTVSYKREDSTIDLAYVFFYLDFKLAPRKIEERHRKQFLFITYGSQTVVRYEDRNMAEKDKEHIFDFYRAKALEGFIQEYPQLAAERDELAAGRDEL